MAATPTPTAPMMNAGHAWMKLAASAVEYARDRAERNLLFWDTMRKRGNVYLEHAIEGKPPLLKFAFELLVDGHTLERPTNYALLHVLPAEGMPQTDPDARPIVIVDPLGNVVMRFDIHDTPKDLLTDLKKLLKLSSIG
ncbi:MAG: DUF3141 domain-containing protein [Burkholderiaceae bacterium]